MNTPNKISNQTFTLIVVAILSSLLTAIIISVFSSDSTPVTGSEIAAEKKPLYWVAPMDANYRRDKPGKSPMGMDLVAVYESGSTASDSGPGTIKISPEVVNNLGVRTAKARIDVLHSQINTVGYVMYDEDQLVHIHPRVKGWIEKLYVKAAGDPVVKNAPLYEIYSPELVNAQDELLLALERNNGRLIKAAEARLRALQIPSKVIQEIKKTRKVSQTITFFAPQDGVIDNLNIREGFYVQPGTTLLSIGQLKEVWVEAEIFENQSALVSKGMRVTMTLAYLPGKEWLGEVDYVYPTLNPKTRTLKVRLRFNNQDSLLKPNMFAQVIIHPDAEEKSLLVPKQAVIRTGSSERVVVALGSGRFKSVEVKVGRFDDNSVEILAGLDAGEEVVTSAQFLLDSESSKSSDFKRMNHPLEVSDSSSSDSKSNSNTEPMTAEVDGVINSLMIEHGMLNISRGPIEKWGRPEATLDFIAAEDVDISNLKAGMKIRFTFMIMDGQFMITKIQKIEQRSNKKLDSK
jgi:Cu(I)/Ag(I) efflux system membrane fusion protein